MSVEILVDIRDTELAFQFSTFSAEPNVDSLILFKNIDMVASKLLFTCDLYAL